MRFPVEIFIRYSLLGLIYEVYLSTIPNVLEHKQERMKVLPGGSKAGLYQDSSFLAGDFLKHQLSQISLTWALEQHKFETP